MAGLSQTKDGGSQCYALLHSRELPLSLLPPSYPHEHGTPTADLDHSSFLSTDQKTSVSRGRHQTGAESMRGEQTSQWQVLGGSRLPSLENRTQGLAEAPTRKQDDQIKL